MVWNSRVSVRDDLVRLHESSRAADMSRDLGYSSISMGEGSLDLIVGDNPDDKRVVLGDQADGRFGISLWHRGELKYAPDVLTDAEDRISATEQKNSTQDHRLDAITTLAEANRGRLDVHDGRLGGIDTKNSTQDHRLDAITTLAEASRGRLDGHDSTLASHNTRIGNAQSRADSAYSRAGTGIANAATAQSRADSAHTRIDGLSYASPAQIAQLNDQIQVLRGRVKALEDWRASLPQG